MTRPTWQVSLKFVLNRTCPIICKVAICTEFLQFKVLGALAKTGIRQIKVNFRRWIINVFMCKQLKILYLYYLELCNIKLY